jgi:hypothetical protein
VGVTLGYHDKGATTEEAKHEFVEACESVMARENDSWRAEWMNRAAANRFISKLEWAESNRTRASGKR